MNAEDLISKARTHLLLKKEFVFWATVGMYQNPVKTPDDSPIWRGGEPTMATDGRNLYYSETFVNKCSFQELAGVVAHEAGHCAFAHHLRRQARNPIAWNIACDLALNPILMKAGLTLPKGVLFDKKWDNMTAEEIYAQLPIKMIPMGASGKGKGKGQGQGKGDGSGNNQGKGQGGDGDGSGFGCGGVIDSPFKGSVEEEKHWEVVIKQAAAVAKGQGTLPGQFEYVLEPIKPKLDLHSMMKHMISVVQEDDYTWAKPNRRHVWQDMYLPSQRTESVGDVLVGVDTSGSISKEECQRFIGVVNVVLSDMKPRNVYLVQCDAAVSDVQEYHKGDVLPPTVGIKGCGGTDMRPIWDWVAKEGKNISCAIICSDFQMDVASFGQQQKFPVLWVTCTKDIKAPWGQTAELKD